MSSWKVVYEGGELVGRHGGVESSEALSVFCGGEVSFNIILEFCIERLYYCGFAVRKGWLVLRVFSVLQVVVLLGWSRPRQLSLLLYQQIRCLLCRRDLVPSGWRGGVGRACLACLRGNL